jgi:hypothetical protein
MSMPPLGAALAPQGGFSGTLVARASFGTAVASIGDVDSDGVDDLAVGAPGGGTNDRGQVWILLLNADGTVKTNTEISDAQVKPSGGASGKRARDAMLRRTVVCSLPIWSGRWL